jgi:type I restriction enzyme S subunit
LAEQQRIVSILGALDDKIDLNRRMCATLDEMARTIFRSWFVDFEPVRAKIADQAEDRKPERASMAATSGRVEDELESLSPGAFANLASTAGLFPVVLQETTIGGAPRGWESRDLGDVCSAIFSGGTPDTRRPEYWDGDLAWLSSGETRGRYIVRTEKRITARGARESSTRPAKPGDLVVASAGQGHTRGQVSYCDIDTFVNQSVVVIRPNLNVVKPSWLFCNLLERYDELRAISDSHSSRGSLTTKHLSALPVLCPPPRAMSVFDDFAAAITQRCLSLTREALTLGSTRDALLRELLAEVVSA